MNGGYLASALDAAQMPTEKNGGMLVNTDQDNYRVAYKVNTALSDIINGLKSQNAVKLKMDVLRASESEFEVKIEGKAGFRIPVASLLGISVSGNASYFKSDIATSKNTVSVEMTFPGTTLVTFGPVPYDFATNQSWYWVDPIQKAIANGDKDVSGFKFAPKPSIDFSKYGPFSFLEGTAISNYPSMKIRVTSENYRRIQETFEQTVKVGVSFLGIPLGIGGSESTYSNKVSVNASSKEVVIELNPPKELVAGTNTDSVGWVLGVLPVYPAS